MLLLLLFAFSGCASTEPVKGVYHRVQSNETLFQIARMYGTTPEAIARANNIDDINLVEKDRVLFIPGGLPPSETTPERGLADREPSIEKEAQRASIKEETLAPSPVEQTPTSERETKVKATTPDVSSVSTPKPSPSKDEKLSFLWPFPGTVVSHFDAKSDGIKTNGISLESEKESPVVAAESGTILHSAPIKFYGETVIIRHPDNYLTIYSQLQKRTVNTGEKVSRGDIIGFPRKNDERNTYTLYFEMRVNNRPVDPLPRLPRR